MVENYRTKVCRRWIYSSSHTSVMVMPKRRPGNHPFTYRCGVWSMQVIIPVFLIRCSVISDSSGSDSLSPMRLRLHATHALAGRNSKSPKIRTSFKLLSKSHPFMESYPLSLRPPSFTLSLKMHLRVFTVQFLSVYYFELSRFAYTDLMIRWIA